MGDPIAFGGCGNVGGNGAGASTILHMPRSKIQLLALCLCLSMTLPKAEENPYAIIAAMPLPPLTALATQGDALAQNELGDRYEKGQGVAKSYALARLWFERAAAQGNTDALVALGFIHGMGKGVAQDDDKMLKLWMDAEALGSEMAGEFLWERHHSLHEYADRRVEKGEHAEALRTWKLLAEQRDSEAARKLAAYYADPKHKDEAQKQLWLTKAADLDADEAASEQNRKDKERALEQDAIAGNAVAQYEWGKELDDYLNPEQDPTKAAQWFEKAAIQGHADAQYALGSLYLNGRGVPKDYAQAFHWYDLAAAQGHADAQGSVALRYATGEGVAQDDAQALVWFRKAAEQGNHEAQFNLGVAYQEGRGTVQDYAQARHWFERASEGFDSEACYNLGFLHSMGWGGPQDYALARQWYEKAVTRGNVLAMANLGLLYQSGQGGTVDYARAMKLYQRPAADNNPPALYGMGTLYAYGLGVKKNLTLGRKWLGKAAALGMQEAKDVLKQLK
jgi:TPR repeat protein